MAKIDKMDHYPKGKMGSRFFDNQRKAKDWAVDLQTVGYQNVEVKKSPRPEMARPWKVSWKAPKKGK